MEIVKKFKMGSSVFFESFDGFKSKDTDWLCLVKNYIGGNKAMRMNIKGDDIVMYRHDFTKGDFINEALSSGISLKLGKFLVKEFIDYFDVTIDDLKSLEGLISKLDGLHHYEKIIYDAYISNGKFELSKSQLDEAYADYVSKRGE